MVKVVNDLLMAADSGLGVVLIMLDLSAVFDTVDHSILLKHLECDVGIKGTALKRCHSYLHDRTFFVNFANTSSSVAPLKYGLPQGSILGPTLFSLYMCPLGSICRRYDISYHMYADDTQIYLPLKVRNELIIFGPPKVKEMISTIAPLELTIKTV